MHTRKKDLTFLAFALILAQATPNASSSHYYWRPRAKIPEKSRFFGGNVSRGTFPNEYLQKSLDSFLLVVVVYNVPVFPDYLFFKERHAVIIGKRIFVILGKFPICKRRGFAFLNS